MAHTTGLRGREGGGLQSSVFRCHRVSLVLVTLNGSSGPDRSETSFKLIAPHSYPYCFPGSFCEKKGGSCERSVIKNRFAISFSFERDQ
jgi:hypothetical protein